ncbi:MAG: hypothetical protein IT541_15720 [Hyphomicrobiales bacterium]|nr:hypothetical protein [Hyphomicrobiales bacterium]
MTRNLDDTLRHVFVGVADVLIPAFEKMPQASAAGVGGETLDRILALRDDLKEPFLRGLRAAAGRPPETAARDLNVEDPKALAAIGLVASAAYYMSPEVRRLIGYPGQDRRPIDPDAPPDYLENNLLQPVIDRGPIYRPTPK